MKQLLLIAGIAALAACGQQQQSNASEEANALAGAETNAAEVTPAAFQLNETTWTFTRKGDAIQESIDANGNYIANAGEKHIDHGTSVMKDDKACFTSAMDKEGEVCWTDPMLNPGQSGETTSDKGEKLTVKRTEYVPLTM